jgi:tyrosinase
MFISRQVLDTTTLLHGYRYDDITDPIATSPQLTAVAAMVAPAPSPQPELVAGSAPVVLDAPRLTVPVPFRPQAAYAARARIGTGRHTRAFLNLENVKGQGPLPKYDVYVDVPPPGRETSGRPPLLAGSLSLFGVQAASDPAGPQGGSGITSVIEITPLVEQLQHEGRWDGTRLHVTFLRRDTGGLGAAARQPLQIGRISVYYD